MYVSNKYLGTYVPINQSMRVTGMETILLHNYDKPVVIDDNLERGYLRIYACHKPVALQQLHGLIRSIPGVSLLADVVVHPQRDELYLHKIDVQPKYDFLWPNLIRYLAEYATKCGYTKVIASGKSTTQSRDTVTQYLCASGFERKTPFHFVLALDGSCK